VKVRIHSQVPLGQSIQPERPNASAIISDVDCAGVNLSLLTVGDGKCDIGTLTTDV